MWLINVPFLFGKWQFHCGNLQRPSIDNDTGLNSDTNDYGQFRGNTVIGDLSLIFKNFKVKLEIEINA
jgi:hypothetical protein